MVRGWCDPTPTPAPTPAPDPAPDPEQVFATELAEEPSAARGGEILSAALGTPTLPLTLTLTLTLT